MSKRYTYQDMTSLVAEPATITYGEYLPGADQIYYLRNLSLQTGHFRIEYDQELNVSLLNQKELSMSSLKYPAIIEKVYIQLKTAAAFSEVRADDPSSYELEKWIITNFIG